MKKTALIMAGGRGERFWPRSRKHMPKQFLSLTDDGKTMIQLTVERIRPLVELEDIYIATNKDYKPLVLEQLPGIPEENILCEPIGRNTAPCIGLGAIHIAKKYEDALMMVLPSDHLIKYNTMFVNTLSEGCAVAEKGANLVTIGITPDYPETGYGYIEKGDALASGFAVRRFVEKPAQEAAEAMLAQGGYFWNSGMFVFRASQYLAELEAQAPAIMAAVRKAWALRRADYDFIRLHRESFAHCPSDSVDYALMEKSAHVAVKRNGAAAVPLERSGILGSHL